ncbi:MAG: hypothetical protein FWD78_07460 [Treponema sp.]|nr:hypothetical protein [Treponema sp.]
MKKLIFIGLAALFVLGFALTGCDNGNNTVYLTEWTIKNDSDYTVTVLVVHDNDTLDTYTEDTTWTPSYFNISPGGKTQVKNKEQRSLLNIHYGPDTVKIAPYVQGSWTVNFVNK